VTDEQIAWCSRRENDLADKGGQPFALDFQARVDRGRVTNSAAFRRLQGKTQVMGVREHDFFRTRLTHSLEVAQIGASVAQQMAWYAHNVAEWEGLKVWLPPEHLIEVACLAHDIGHPPFGHNGEKIFNYYMHAYGGFEGNGQTFRVLSRLGEYSERCGYDLCRRTMLATLKYPVLFHQVAPNYPDAVENLPRNISPWNPPKALHDDDAQTLAWVLEPFAEGDKARFQSLQVLPNGERKSQYKSFDCSIMELADDIAYGVHDLEDALAMGMLTPEQVAEELRDELAAIAALRKRPENYYMEKLLGKEQRLLKQAITNMVHSFVFACHPSQQDAFVHPLLKFQAQMQPEAKLLLEALKRYVFVNVIDQPRLNTLAYKGRKIIAELFEAFLADPQHLLPKMFSSRLVSGDEQSLHRNVCDYIASMTDGEAASMYERLYLPGQGSVFEPV
jgi:dGTPase